MDDSKKLFVARNEIENEVTRIQNMLGLSDMDMSIVLEMVLSTARYKALVRSLYGEVNAEKKEK